MTLNSAFGGWKIYDQTHHHNFDRKKIEIPAWIGMSGRTAVKILQYAHRNIPGKFSFEQWEALVRFYAPGFHCPACGEVSFMTIDHVVPATRGGTNFISNIQPLCSRCNSRKGNRGSEDFRFDKGRHAFWLAWNC